MAKYQILNWHDIPVQVRVRDRNGRVSKPLPNRFQVAIDRAAMRAGLIGQDAYTDGFHWSRAQERDGSAQEVSEAITAELDALYPKIDWRKNRRQFAKR